jgi:hypothetical protein
MVEVRPSTAQSTGSRLRPGPHFPNGVIQTYTPFITQINVVDLSFSRTDGHGGIQHSKKLTD